ncbi:hypothetical protein HELRODRAFT_171145 [Helobdella robusta]|uniref:Uncharacterized protein n=1 Tax=Helobdella robusta TaxID=6412 RepID=T1F3U9_HELRO|nr:hypothetical protein HELRODRAFT_171145 [Helobdella robusta]ESO05507.1 hypothetical protein HELRODRAFT_171145 [Helobdella robusta]
MIMESKICEAGSACKKLNVCKKKLRSINKDGLSVLKTCWHQTKNTNIQKFRMYGHLCVLMHNFALTKKLYPCTGSRPDVNMQTSNKQAWVVNVKDMTIFKLIKWHKSGNNSDLQGQHNNINNQYNNIRPNKSLVFTEQDDNDDNFIELQQQHHHHQQQQQQQQQLQQQLSTCLPVRLNYSQQDQLQQQYFQQQRLVDAIECGCYGTHFHHHHHPIIPADSSKRFKMDFFYFCKIFHLLGDG